MNTELNIKNFGPIKNANIKTGDLTVFVGPQSTGKTLTSQLLFQIWNYKTIIKHMRNSGSISKSFWQSYFPSYFNDVFKKKCELIYRNYPNAEFSDMKKQQFAEDVIKTYYIPAQRSSFLFYGFPLILQLPSKLSYPVKMFSTQLSEALSQYSANNEFVEELFEVWNMESFLLPGEHLNETYTDLINKIIFGIKFKFIENKYGQKELMGRINGSSIEYSNLASGIQESFPILLMYQKLVYTRKEKFMLIIEEPETNLYPDSILALSTLLMHLLNKGNKILITTHSPYILELIQMFKIAAQKWIENPNDTKIANILRNVLKIDRKRIPIKRFLPIDIEKKKLKDIKIYHFDKDPKMKTTAKDISDLSSEISWGGLASFTFDIAQATMELQER